ncbi:glycosyltransferase [Lactobacillus johnsonii]|uniref:glycosyltransferase n=1 Tax=Lactobacillus johnsonii TaxID=33959 RepID=UPI00388F0C73
MPWIKNVEDYLRDYDKVFCVSKTIKSVFDNLYPQFNRKSEVFYNFVDINNILFKSQEFIPIEFDKKEYNIVSVGRLTEQKGFDIVLKAAYILKKKDFKFKWFVIGDGKDKKKLNKQLRKLKLEDSFFFLGKKANPYPYVKNADLFVLPSRHEGYGLATLEARILKKMVIVSDLPVSREQI